VNTNIQHRSAATQHLKSLFAVIVAILLVTACAQVPPEAVDLSTTVGRDLEEVHRAHRAIADRYFDLIENDINRFIDEVYGPAYVTAFAKDFKLDKKVTQIVAQAPQNLLPVMTRFVDTAVGVIEEKRAEVLGPLKQQRRSVITQIDDAHRQIQAAQALVTGHLASVRRVHDMQNEMLKTAGLDGMREDIGKKTADMSDRVEGLIKEGEKADGKIDEIEDVLVKIKDSFN
jgi:hypothetical protein